jgi:hypothetical protein
MQTTSPIDLAIALAAILGAFIVCFYLLYSRSRQGPGSGPVRIETHTEKVVLVICPYCSAKVEQGVTECPSCGGRI